MEWRNSNSRLSARLAAAFSFHKARTNRNTRSRQNSLALGLLFANGPGEVGYCGLTFERRAHSDLAFVFVFAFTNRSRTRTNFLSSKELVALIFKRCNQFNLKAVWWLGQSLVTIVVPTRSLRIFCYNYRTRYFPTAVNLTLQSVDTSIRSSSLIARNHGALYLVKWGHWLARQLPHLTISWAVFKNKIYKIALQNNPSFCWMGKLSGKPVAPF